MPLIAHKYICGEIHHRPGGALLFICLGLGQMASATEDMKVLVDKYNLDAA